MSQDRFKNTDAGVFYIDTYKSVDVSQLQAISNAGVSAATFSPQDYGITDARFALVQVITDDADVVVQVGISGSVTEPATGSMRVGRNFGMPFIQLPRAAQRQIKVLGDPNGSASTVQYTVTFVD